MTTATLLAKIDTSKVTDEQIGRCTKIFDTDGTPFYAVLSESDNLTEYHVKFVRTPRPHFSCTCPAGREGRSCKHVRWAIAASREEKAALAEMAQASAAQAKPALLVDGKPADAETLARVFSAQPAPSKNVKPLVSRPFSLLK